ncbi:MAG: alkaline phosphatase family protein [Opitutaceae bacterium]|nr:alkaline phosphatase family protein [Opitutaceae bacterium]
MKQFAYSRSRFSRFLWVLPTFVLLFGAPAASAVSHLKTRNVILINSDGLRWQEVFSGADSALIPKPPVGIATSRLYLRDTPEARREILMPFFWNVIAKQGQLYGNRTKGSTVEVTNNQWFSYPGRNEYLTGFDDPRITSNSKIPNSNVTVLEWLHHKPAFQGSVAAFSAWDVVPFIINRDRCGFPVMGGWEEVPKQMHGPRMELLNQLIRDTTPANDAELYDSFLYQAAHEYLVTKHPRVMYIDFLETDHWGHAGRYDLLLRAAHEFDDYVRRIWETVQSSRQYRNKTTLILVTDHGRGNAPDEWKSHGRKIEGAQYIWMGFLGPDTPPLGERSNCQTLTQSQVAATLTAYLGEDYNQSEPRAALPVAEALPSSR